MARGWSAAWGPTWSVGSLDVRRPRPGPVRCAHLRCTIFVSILVGALLSSATTSQAQSNIWNDYAGSSSVFFSYSGYASVLGNDTFPGSPQLNIDVNDPGGVGAGFSTLAVMDTGSTGLVISLTKACTNGVITCTGNSPGTYAPAPSAVIGYSTFKYTSDNLSYTGFYTNAKVTIFDASHTLDATAQIPVFVAVNITDHPQSLDPAPDNIAQFGIGFGRGSASGVQLTDANGNPNGVTLYSKNFNAFMNLTSLTGVSDISSVAPGYVVTKTGVYLGLSPTAVGAINGPLVALTPTPQTPGSNVSTYAVTATKNEWQTPPIVASVSGNTSSTRVNGQYYGTMLVDTGVSDAIFTTGGTRISQAMITSPTVTNITIGLPGISTSNGTPQSQYTYVYQGTCQSVPPDNVGCGPSLTPFTPYDGGRSSQMVPVYPISATDSFKNGYQGNNTGFADTTTAAPFLNAGVNFLNYFDVVYDPVSGFIGYLPNGTSSGVPSDLLLVTPTQALQGPQIIPDGTNVTVPLYLFTAIGNQTTPDYVPVDVVLSAASAGGQVTISTPIASDAIAGCTLNNCSTGLVINQGTFNFDANNTYAGATTINTGATLALGPNGSIATSFGVTANGTFDVSGTLGASISSLSGIGLVSLGSQTLTITEGNSAFSGTIADGGTSGGTAGSVAIDGGKQVLNGINSYTGQTNVNAGILDVNGSLTSTVLVNSDGTLMGSGTVGGITMASGGTVAPGNSIGTLNVAGDVTFIAGSAYQVEANAAGQSDKIIATGTGTLSGGTVQVLAQAGAYAPSTTYTILSVPGGLSGAFAAVTSNLAFLTPSLAYDPTDVFLTLTRNDNLFSDVAQTPNQRAVASALETYPTDDSLFLAVLNQTSAGARQAFDALDGEVHASIAGVLVDQSRYVRDAIWDRLTQAFYTSDPNQTVAIAAGGPTVVAALDSGRMALGAGSQGGELPAYGRGLTFWTRGFGSWGEFDGNDNAATADRNLGGSVSGMDAGVGDGWRAGIATGYIQSSINVPARASSADVSSYLFAGYAGGGVGPVALRSGAAWSWQNIDTSRAVIFPGFFEHENASYGANTGELFAEAAYPMITYHGAVEPFAGLAYVHLDTSGFAESGATAALTSSGSSEDVGYSMLGVRAATTLPVAGMLVTPRASVAWQYAFGDVTPDLALAFASTGIAFGISGAPLARNSALIEAGLDFAVGADAALSVTYAGQLAGNLQDNGVRGQFNWRF
jgi:outer membrane autotransporter protein